MEKKARPMEKSPDKIPDTQQKFFVALSTIFYVMNKISSWHFSTTAFSSA